jgi:hypothetical protein
MVEESQPARSVADLPKPQASAGMQGNSAHSPLFARQAFVILARGKSIN